VTPVLVVDDEPAIVPLLELCLDHLSLELLHATGLSSALEHARQQRVSLVLLDIALGSEGGLEMLPQLLTRPVC